VITDDLSVLTTMSADGPPSSPSTAAEDTDDRGQHDDEQDNRNVKRRRALT
jgi:hypothetical protein